MGRFIEGGPTTWGSEVAALFMVPLIESVAQGKMSVEGRDVETLGAAMMKMHDELWQSDDPLARIVEVEKLLEEKDFPELLKVNMVHALRSMSDVEAGFMTATEPLDALYVGKLLRLVPKMFKNISAISRVAGKTRGVTKTRTEHLATELKNKGILSPDAEDELISNVVPSHAQDIPNTAHGEAAEVLEEVFTTSVKGQAADTLDDQVKALQEIADTVQTGMLQTKTEIAKAALDVTHDMKKSLTGAAKVADVYIEPSGPTRRIFYYLGSGESNTGGFGTPTAAHSKAKSLGLHPSMYKIKGSGKADGEYLIEVKRDLPYEDINTGKSHLDPINLDKAGVILPSLRKVLTTKALTGVNTSITEGGITGTNTVARLNKIIYEGSKPYRAMSRSAQKELDTALLYTQQNNGGRWLTMKEFQKFYRDKVGRVANDEDMAGYGAMININRADLYVRDSKVRVDLVGAGYQETLIKGLQERPSIGKVLQEFDRKSTKSYTIYDSINGVHYGKGDPLKSKMMKLLKERDDLVIVKYLDDIPVGDGKKARYIIASKKSTQQQALPYRLINDVGGPHRQYLGDFWMRQARFNEDGFEVTPKTHFNFESVAEGTEYAAKYNEALHAYKKATHVNATEVDVADAERIISENTRFKGLDEMQKAVDNDVIQLTDFEIMPSGVLSNRKDMTTSDIDPDILHMSDTTRGLISRGQLYYSSRGDHLKHPVEGLAPVLNHGDTLNNAIKDIINTKAFYNYRKREMTRWLDRFGHAMDANWSGRPDYEKFVHGNLDPKHLTYTERANAEAMRESIKRILNLRSPTQEKIEDVKNAMAQYVYDGNANILGKTMTKTALKVGNMEPLTAARSAVFKILFTGDYSQIGLQLSMAPALVAAHPVVGTQALALLTPLRMALQSAGEPRLTKHLGDVMSTVVGGKLHKAPIDGKVFTALVKEIRKQGVDIVGGTQTQLDNTFDSLIEHKSVGQYVGKAIDIGLLPFKEGERLNNILAYSTRWLKHYTETGKIPTSEKELMVIANHAETLAGNMKSSSQAWWNKGLMSVATQVVSHPLRVGELVLNSSGGMSGPERVRYFAGVLAVYGSTGMGVGGILDTMVDYYEKQTGEAIDPDTYRKLHSGLMGQLLPDQEIKRLQPMANTIIHHLLDPEQKLHETLGGAAYGILGDLMQSIAGATVWKDLVSGEVVLKDLGKIAFKDLKDIARVLPVVNRHMKAYNAHLFDMYISKKGDLISIGDMSNFDKFMMAQGMMPRKSQEAAEVSWNAVQVEKGIKETGKKISQMIFNEQFQDDSLMSAQKSIQFYKETMEPHHFAMLQKNIEGELNKIAKGPKLEMYMRKIYEVYGLHRVTRIMGKEGATE